MAQLTAACKKVPKFPSKIDSAKSLGSLRADAPALERYVDALRRVESTTVGNDKLHTDFVDYVKYLDGWVAAVKAGNLKQLNAVINAGDKSLVITKTVADFKAANVNGCV